MLPDDTDFVEAAAHDAVASAWVNAIQLSTDMRKATGTANMTYPLPTDTTLPWGGGRILLWQENTGIGPGVTDVIDSTMDYRNRLIIVLEAGAYADPDDAPGGTSWDGLGDMGYGLAFNTGSFWTKTGATPNNPPVGYYYTLSALRAFLFVNPTNHALYYSNQSGAATDYPFLMLLVSDQFPTRT